MNKLQSLVLEQLVTRATRHADYKPTPLYEALDCHENSLEDAILEVLEDGAYIVPADMSLSLDSIERILEYGVEVDLTLEFGFGSVLESYVISQISRLIGVDLLEEI